MMPATQFISKQEELRITKLALIFAFIGALFYLLINPNYSEAVAYKLPADYQPLQGVSCAKDPFKTPGLNGVFEPTFFCILVPAFDVAIGYLYENIGKQLNDLVILGTAIAFMFLGFKVLTSQAKLTPEFFILIGKIGIVFAISFSASQLWELCNFIRSASIGLSGITSEGMGSVIPNLSLLPDSMCKAGTVKTVLGSLECVIKEILWINGLVVILGTVLFFLGAGWGLQFVFWFVGASIGLFFIAVRVFAYFLITFITSCLLLSLFPIFGTLWFFKIGQEPFKKYIQSLLANILLPVIMTLVVSFCIFMLGQFFSSFKDTVYQVENDAKDRKNIYVVAQESLQNIMGWISGASGDFEVLDTPDEKKGGASWYGPGFYNANGVACGGINGVAAQQLFRDSYHIALRDADQLGQEKKYCGQVTKVINQANCKFTYAPVFDTGTLAPGRIIDLTEAVADDLGTKAAGVVQSQVLLGSAIKDKAPACSNPQPTDVLKKFCFGGTTGRAQQNLTGARAALTKKFSFDICNFSSSGTPSTPPTDKKNLPNTLGCTQKIPSIPATEKACPLRNEVFNGIDNSARKKIENQVGGEITKINANSKLTDQQKKDAIKQTIKDWYGIGGKGSPISTSTNVKFNIADRVRDCEVFITAVSQTFYNPILDANGMPVPGTDFFNLCSVANRQYDNAWKNNKTVDPSKYFSPTIASTCSNLNIGPNLRKGLQQSGSSFDPSYVNEFDCRKIVRSLTERIEFVSKDGTKIKIPHTHIITDPCVITEICAREAGFLADAPSNTTVDVTPLNAEDQAIGSGIFSLPIPTDLAKIMKFLVGLALIAITLLVINGVLKDMMSIAYALTDFADTRRAFSDADSQIGAISDTTQKVFDVAAKGAGGAVSNKMGRTNPFKK
ncbi:MAG: hypothetical protein ACK5BE_00325 [Alphaproteobacteria bacterium]